MPIWQTSELEPNRPGKPGSPQRVSSRGNPHAQPPCRAGTTLSLDGYRMGSSNSSDIVATRPKSVASSRRSATATTRAAARPSSSAVHTIHHTRAPQALDGTYTVQYIGVARGELGILTQKQALTPQGHSSAIRRPYSSRTSNTAASAKPTSPRATATTTQSPQRPAATSPSPAPAPPSAPTPPPPMHTLTLPASAAPPGSSPSSPSSPIHPGSPRRHTDQPTDSIPLTSSHSPTQDTQLPSQHAPATDQPHSDPESTDPSDPPQPSGSSFWDAAAASAAEAHEAGTGDFWRRGSAPPPALQRPSSPQPPVPGAADSPASAASTPRRPPLAALSALVEDAAGAVRVVGDQFYSRALRSRGGPRDHRSRRNLPAAPPVRDMQPASTALPNRFARRAPGAGGFPGWKLTAAAAAAAADGTPVGPASAAGNGSAGGSWSGGAGAGVPPSRQSLRSSYGASRSTPGLPYSHDGGAAEAGDMGVTGEEGQVYPYTHTACALSRRQAWQPRGAPHGTPRVHSAPHPQPEPGRHVGNAADGSLGRGRGGAGGGMAGGGGGPGHGAVSGEEGVQGEGWDEVERPEEQGEGLAAAPAPGGLRALPGGKLSSGREPARLAAASGGVLQYM